jgi:hypothetical protein
MQPLLKPEEVAELLQLSLATIYAKAHNLGGFFPAGIKALRFRRETIYAIMENQKRVPVPVSARQEEVQQDGVPYHKSRRKVGSQETGGIREGSSDPTIIADAIRFGLRAPGHRDVDGKASKSS